MIFAPLNRADDDKGRATWRDDLPRSGKRIAAEPCGLHRWHRQSFMFGEGCKFVQRCFAVGNHSSGGVQHCANPLPVPVGLAGAAELWVSDWDQIVDQVNGSDRRSLCPRAEAGQIEAGMPDVEIEPTVPPGIQSGQMPQ